MSNRIENVAGAERLKRLVVDTIDGGMSGRTVAEKLASNRLDFVLNGTYFQDGTILKRPGNNPLGPIGTGVQWDAMGVLYSVTNNTLVAKSNTALYAQNEGSFVWNKISGATVFGPTGTPMSFAQMYDPAYRGGGANAKAILICCDGTQVPYGYDGANFAAFATTNLPLNRAGLAAITPSLCIEWGPNIVFSGEPTEPTGVYISDVLNPEHFSTIFVDANALGYTAFFPGTRDGSHGVVRQIAVINNYLVVFFDTAIAVGVNTGSYGAMQFQWRFLSRSIGTVAPLSVVAMDRYIIWYSGNAFYATDGEAIYPLPDLLPTFYSWDNIPWYSPQLDLASPSTLVGGRYFDQYWACNPQPVPGTIGGVLVFDTSTGGGFTPGQTGPERADEEAFGGAWAVYDGMAIACSVFTPYSPFYKTPRMYWGSGMVDNGFNFGFGVNGGWDDNGAAIDFHVRTRAYYFGAPNAPATVQNVTAKLCYPQNGRAFISNPTLYTRIDLVEYDQAQNVAVPTTPTFFDPATVFPITQTGYPQPVAGQLPLGYAVQLGVRESSTSAIGVTALSAEVSVDEPRPSL